MRSKLGPGVGLFLVSLLLLLGGSRASIAQSVGLAAFVTVDRGCGATYRIGDGIRVNFGATKAARLRLIFQKDEFTPVTLFDRFVFGPSDLVIRGTIGQPAGVIRKLVLVATAGTERVSQQCDFFVRTGSQNLLTGSVRTNKGCGVAFGTGESIRFIVNSSLPAHARVTLDKPDGTILLLFDADVSAGDTLVASGVTGAPLGARFIHLRLTRSDTNSVNDTCRYDVVVFFAPGSGG
jgi:hypothetical protein